MKGRLSQLSYTGLINFAFISPCDTYSDDILIKYVIETLYFAAKIDY